MRRLLGVLVVSLALASSVSAACPPELVVAKSGSTFLVGATLYSDSCILVTGGPTTYSMFELQTDGTYKSFDFNDSTFKTTALTTATASLTARSGNNSTVALGTWTATRSTTGFTTNNVYLLQVTNTAAYPQVASASWQYATTSTPGTGGSGRFFIISRLLGLGQVYAMAQ